MKKATSPWLLVLGRVNRSDCSTSLSRRKAIMNHNIDETHNQLSLSDKNGFLIFPAEFHQPTLKF